VGAKRRYEDHGSLEREVDGAAAEMLRPVDQERGLIGDVDRAPFAKAEQAVPQTGGDAAVSTA
jgi:hypothetical protein